MHFQKAKQLGFSVLFKFFIYFLLSQSYSYLNLTKLDKIFQNVTSSFLVAKNADKCFSARKIGCKVFDHHYQDVDSHCLLKSKMKIFCQAYFYRSIDFLQTTCLICCIRQRAKFDFNQEYLQKYEEKHDTNTFSERTAYDKFIFEGFILFPLGKVK